MINTIHTSCKDCAFATYSGKTQKGCSADMLESYRKRGAEVIDVYDDAGKEFFVINDKLCSHHRDKEWAKKYSKSELLNIVNSQTKSPYHAILVYSQDSSLEGLSLTVASLARQFNPPNIISILNMKTAKSIYKINMEFEKVLTEYEDKFDWRIQNIIHSETTTRQSIDLAIDGTYFKYSFPYYIVFECGFAVPDEFSKELHDSVTFDGKQVVFASPLEGTLNGMLVNRMLHRKHTGNAFNIHIEDKLEAFEEGIDKHIFPILSLCPSMNQK